MEALAFCGTETHLGSHLSRGRWLRPTPFFIVTMAPIPTRGLWFSPRPMLEAVAITGFCFPARRPRYFGDTPGFLFATLMQQRNSLSSGGDKLDDVGAPSTNRRIGEGYAPTSTSDGGVHDAPRCDADRSAGLQAIRRACVRTCLGGSGATGDLSQVMRVAPGRVKACITRCSIAPCIKRRLRLVSVTQPLNVFATTGFKPVAMLASP